MKYAIDRFAAGAGLETPKITRSPNLLKSGARLTGLDGLRAVAVLAVMLFHADLSFARGGFLGVDLFFVISGFLITGLLLGESEDKGRLDLKQFYWRRAKRLLPASWAMTAAAVLAAALLAPDALPRLRWDTLASLFYVTNWELTFAGKSYFEFVGRQPLLLHLWSLAIEEQFYIVWAPVMLILLPRIKARTLALGALVAAAAGIVWMAVLAAKLGYPETGDPTRLYFGTDTHGFGLLIGAALGLLWRPGERAKRLSLPDQEGMFLFGGLALVGSFATFFLLDETKAWLYPWGFVLSAGLSVSLIVAATHPGAGFGRWMDAPVLRWIGERSYGLYLWHWPIYMLTRPDLDLAWPEHWIVLLRFGLTFLIAGLSYRYVEMPIRQGALEKLAGRWRIIGRDAVTWRPVTAALLAGATAVAAVAVLYLAPNHTTPPADMVQAMNVASKAAPVPIVQLKTGVAAAPDTVSGDVSAIGDSVLLGSSGVLSATIPSAKLYAQIGWQASQVEAQIRELHDAGALTPVVILHLGTNGFVLESQMRRMLDLLKDCKRVVLVNTHVPRRWMDPNNEMMARVVADYPNTVLADWKTVSDQQADFFISDGIHLTPPGRRAFISAIIRAGHIALPAGSPHAIDPNATYAYAPGDLSKTLVRYSQPMALDAFWFKVARCTSGGVWSGGRPGGGLAIEPETWTAWGGDAFAATASLATPEQQIAIANRISTQGWTRGDGTVLAPLGFGGWRCSGAKPELVSYTPDSVMAQAFHWLERGQVVRDLQLMLGLPRDGIYSRHTGQKHLALLIERGLPAALAGVAR